MIKQLRDQGMYLIDIANQIGCSERTVRRQLALPAPQPHPKRAQRPCKLDPYKDFIDKQLSDNIWNAEVIFQMLLERGYTGCRSLVRKYIQPNYINDLGGTCLLL